jgi:hypothetical protein
MESANGMDRLLPLPLWPLMAGGDEQEKQR